MFQPLLYPVYRSWVGYPAFPWWYGGYPGYNSYYGSNIIGSAIAAQNANVIGSPGSVIGQTATPTVIW